MIISRKMSIGTREIYVNIRTERKKVPGTQRKKMRLGIEALTTKGDIHPVSRFHDASRPGVVENSTAANVVSLHNRSIISMHRHGHNHANAPPIFLIVGRDSRIGRWISQKSIRTKYTCRRSLTLSLSSSTRLDKRGCLASIDNAKKANHKSCIRIDAVIVGQGVAYQVHHGTPVTQDKREQNGR
ncbi:hypothetical protein JAAARDRAFT_525367 [Jaapia argillacea MUCL 33604]|uniref:Uncharacterized protein n=1 Tax=Jaapia argillacea MUCL 33604 TaxID=933084 RepID=A0A067Q6V6_9AGAM|nr:hypothetical protein JAAARDRAFT_525367 [Jaapia argillacea MUCL 33604]